MAREPLASGVIQSIDKFPGRTVRIDGNDWLYCGGTAYLGLQDHRVFQSRFAENLFKYGTSYGASRQSNLRIQIFEEAETSLAHRSQAPFCLTLSSGYLAARFLITRLQENGYRIFPAPLSHPAVHPAEEAVYPDSESLLQAVETHLNSNDPRTPAVVFDTVDFTGSEYANPLWLNSLPLASIALVADDSHGLGIMGEQGAGAYPLLAKRQPKALFTCASLAKACGLPGGAVFGPKETLEPWRNHSSFAGASPMSPAALATYVQSGDLYLVQLEKLRRNLIHFESLVNGSKFLIQTKNHPAISHRSESLANAFEKSHIITSRFPYPTVESPNINRIIITASHLAGDLERVAELINR